MSHSEQHNTKQKEAWAMLCPLLFFANIYECLLIAQGWPSLICKKKYHENLPKNRLSVHNPARNFDNCPKLSLLILNWFQYKWVRNLLIGQKGNSRYCCYKGAFKYYVSKCSIILGPHNPCVSQISNGWDPPP